MMKIIPVILLLACSMSCMDVDLFDFNDYDIGCHELSGRYVADSGDYPDIIEIRDDGTYSHTYHLYPNTPEITTQGSWSCQIRDGKTDITFRNFLFGTDFDMSEEKPLRETVRSYTTNVHIHRGTVRICLPHDYYSYWVKQ
jgi:hypothetical protein